MSFGKPSVGSAAMTSQLAGALTQQIAKDERMARRALDAKLAKLEAEEGELLPPPPLVPPPAVTLVEPVQPTTSRALNCRVNAAFQPRPMQSTNQEEFVYPQPEDVEPIDRKHFHSMDAVSRHAEAQVRFAALMKDGAAKGAPK